MPEIPGSVSVTGFVAPTDSADTYPSHSEEYGKGGYRSVDTLTDRDAIPAARRKAGMAVKVLANKMEYILGAGLGNSHWEKNPTGSMELGAYSELEALNGSQLVDGSTFFCRYRESQTYGGSGHFYFSSSSTVTADGAMVIQPADNSGRFHRIWEGEPINPIWFGAKPTVGDRSGGATLIDPGIDNAVPINAAMAWARTPSYGPSDLGGTVILPPGDWWHSTPILMQPRVNFVAEGTTFGSEYLSHRDPRGMASGRSRLWLRSASNCCQLDFDPTYAPVYSPNYDDDAVITYQTFTLSLANPGVFTTPLPHGRAVGDSVYLFTGGTLPTYTNPNSPFNQLTIASGSVAYVVAVLSPTTFTASPILLNSAVGGGVAFNTSSSAAPSGTHTITFGSSKRRQYGLKIRGIQFNGNGDNQTRNDCDGIRLVNAWNVDIENCGFQDHRGYFMFLRELNGCNMRGNNLYGSQVTVAAGGEGWISKGVFMYSCGDTKFDEASGGGVTGPALWISGNYAWQGNYNNNFLYNSVVRKYTISSIANADEITFSANHQYENGSPIEFYKTASGGAVLPKISDPVPYNSGLLTIGQTYVVHTRATSDFTTVGAASNAVGTIFIASGTGSGLLDINNTVKFMQTASQTRSYWAIKTAANKLKVAYNYFDAIAGVNPEYLQIGSGTCYIWHGDGSGIYQTGGHDNTFVGNRCEQNESHGIHLNGAKGNTLTGNKCNVNEFDSEFGAVVALPAAGIYLRNASTDNVIVGNVFSDQDGVGGVNYPQTYGIWVEANNGRIWIGPNSYRANLNMVSTLIDTTGNTAVEWPVTQTQAGTSISSALTVHVPTNATPPLTITRDDTGHSWAQYVSSNLIRFRNQTLGLYGLVNSASSTNVDLYLGADGSTTSAPRSCTIYGELTNAAAGTDVAGSNLTIVSSPGTGNSTSNGNLILGTPDAGSTGTVVQTVTGKLILRREGQLQFFSRSAAPTVGVADGQVYYSTTVPGLQVRHAGNWIPVGEPNSIGVATITADASASYTFFPLSSKKTQLLMAPITATRTVTLSTTSAQRGTEATFTRSAASTGAFNWSIGGLKNLTAGTWATVAYNGTAAAVTFTSANPGVFTSVAHGFSDGTNVKFATTGALPTNIVAGTIYYVISAGLTADNFEVSATVGGAAIDTTSGTPSGTHTVTNTTWALTQSGSL